MGLFKKKNVIYAPANGVVKSIDQVKDEMFSTKLLGDGFAVVPTDDLVTAPIEGTVVSVFPTKHAISLKTKNGLEVLVHIGIDTVELNGAGFDTKVSEGDKVTAESVLANVDFPFLASQGKETDVIVVFTNSAQRTLVITEKQGRCGQAIGVINE